MVNPNVNNAPYQAPSGNGWQVNTALLTTGGTAQPPLAAHMNQLLTTHAITPHYQGFAKAIVNGSPSNTQSFTGGATGLWIGQRFQSDGSSLGYVMTNFGLGSYPDGSLDPAFVQVYSDVAGKPGSPVTGSFRFTLTPEYLYATPLTLMLPLAVPSTSLVSGQFYWIVIGGTRTSSGTESYFWDYQTTADTNKYYSTSSNGGSTWTNQTGGMYIQIFSNDVVGQLAWVDVDGGGTNTPWLAFYRFTSGGSIATNVFEYYPGQFPGGRMYIQSIRAINTSDASMQTGVI